MGTSEMSGGSYEGLSRTPLILRMGGSQPAPWTWLHMLSHSIGVVAGRHALLGCMDVIKGGSPALDPPLCARIRSRQTQCHHALHGGPFPCEEVTASPAIPADPHKVYGVME